MHSDLRKERLSGWGGGREHLKQKTEYFKDASGGGWLGEVAFYSIPRAEEKEQVVSFPFFLFVDTQAPEIPVQKICVKAHSSARPPQFITKLTPRSSVLGKAFCRSSDQTNPPHPRKGLSMNATLHRHARLPHSALWRFMNVWRSVSRLTG